MRMEGHATKFREGERDNHRGVLLHAYCNYITSCTLIMIVHKMFWKTVYFPENTRYTCVVLIAFIDKHLCASTVFLSTLVWRQFCCECDIGWNLCLPRSEIDFENFHVRLGFLNPIHSNDCLP